MNTRQEVQNPPHGDELETAMASELDAFLQKQSALANERMKTLESRTNELRKIMHSNQERARLALTAYAQTMVVVRQEYERLTQVVDELTYGLETVDDVIRSGNGKIRQ